MNEHGMFCLQARDQDKDGDEVATKTADSGAVDEEKQREEMDKQNMAVLMCSLQNRDECTMCGS